MPQAGQAQHAGIEQAGIDRFEAIKTLVQQGRSPQGLAVEKAFLRKIRADKGITQATYAEERASRRRRQARPVAVAPPMDAAAVAAAFEE